MVVAAADGHARAADARRLHQPTRHERERGPCHRAGPPAIAAIDDLSGREVFVRQSPATMSLNEVEREARAKGSRRSRSVKRSESLEDDDLLEMVNAGLIPATVVDDYLAEFWKQVFTVISRPHVAAPHRRQAGGRHPQEQPEARRRAERVHREGRPRRPRPAPILNKRYLESTKFVKNATSEAERKKFVALMDLFRNTATAISSTTCDGGAGLPGVAARPGRQEPGRGDRRDAADARDRRRNRRSATSRRSSRTSTPA